MNARSEHYPKAILFDLLTALLDSWSLWNRSAGTIEAGRAWRAEYLRLTYGCGRYVAYETLVRQAAENVGLPPSAPHALEDNWLTLEPWPEARNSRSSRTAPSGSADKPPRSFLSNGTPS